MARQLVKVNQDMYARLFKMLLDDPLTAHESAEETGMHIITAQSLMRTMSDFNTMQKHIAVQLNDRINRQIDQRLLEQVSLHLFGTSDVQLVQDVFEAVQRVPDVRDNILAIRTKRRIGAA